MTEFAMEQRGEIPPWTQGWRMQRSLSWAGMTTNEMADELGVARSTVSRWCNDKGRPTKGYLRLWALRTGVPFGWLTGVEELTNGETSDIRTGIYEDSAKQPSTADIQSMMKSIGDLVPLVRPADAARVRGAVR